MADGGRERIVLRMNRLVVLIIAALCALAAASAALGSSQYWLILDQPDPAYGDSITFTKSPYRTSFVWVKCYQPADGHGQNRTEVYSYAAQYGNEKPVFVLVSDTWDSTQAASCVAELGSSGQWRPKARTSFTVRPAELVVGSV